MFKSEKDKIYWKDKNQIISKIHKMVLFNKNVCFKPHCCHLSFKIALPVGMLLVCMAPEWPYPGYLACTINTYPWTRNTLNRYPSGDAGLVKLRQQSITWPNMQRYAQQLHCKNEPLVWLIMNHIFSIFTIISISGVIWLLMKLILKCTALALMQVPWLHGTIVLIHFLSIYWTFL